MMIAVIGSGNVGGALATKWAGKGHQVILGVRDMNTFKGKHLLAVPGITAAPVAEAVRQSEVILISTPATQTLPVVRSLGDTTGKVIIDAMNTVMGKGAEGFANTTEAILANTQTRDVVKCFNTTGFNNMVNPVYQCVAIDLFVAGDSARGRDTAIQLAKDAGFADCYSIGGNDKFTLMEQFAWFWINLAMFQGQGREIAFKLLKR
ncbi:MAG: NAD(P)-binding domain-containing protein [Bacteroidetes bacterium]|nr:NAD(P)-binding domain-containing protein [Bacteroidota bacterium]